MFNYSFLRYKDLNTSDLELTLSKSLHMVRLDSLHVQPFQCSKVTYALCRLLSDKEELEK